MSVAVQVDAEGEKLEAVVDEDIAAFEKFMMEKVDDSGPLSGPERAIIKTYLWWKTHDVQAAAEEEE